MKLLYVANARFPTTKAHGLQIAKMCEAYSRKGVDVTLVVPRRRNQIKEDPFDYYGVERIFQVLYIPVLDTVGVIPIIGYRVELLTFIIGSWLACRKKCSKDAVIVTRDIVIARVLGKRQRVFYEMHDFPKKNFSLWRQLIKKTSGIITTNRWKKQKVINNFDVPASRIFVSPNGFDPKLFKVEEDRRELREKLNLPRDAFILCYVGSLRTMAMDKGIDVVLSALRDLPGDTIFLVVGGISEDIDDYKNRARGLGVIDRVMFVGHVPHRAVPSYLKAADILLAPFPDTTHYRHHMSPIKLFEYMASSTPTVVTDLPSIREIVGESMAYFVPPSSPVSLGRVIASIRDNYNDALQKGGRAKTRMENFTWGKRAGNIINFIKSINIQDQ